jgi:hypothetical protein
MSPSAAGAQAAAMNAGLDVPANGDNSVATD